MVKKTKGSGKYGARYGGSIKQKRIAIETKQKKEYTCPLCLKQKVTRLFSGVWHCKKCNVKFAGRAYSLRE